MDTKRC
jgi:hypothetical protein